MFAFNEMALGLVEYTVITMASILDKLPYFLSINL